MSKTLLGFLAALAFASLIALDAAASQCPPYGTICASNKCAGAVGGFCCCAPYCNGQPNGSVRCGCNQFCPASCSQACSGNCQSATTCYVGGPGGGADGVPLAGFTLTEEARRTAAEGPYGVLVTEALSAFTGGFAVPFSTTAFTSGGTVHTGSLPAPWSRQDRYVAFKALWAADTESVTARIVFLGNRAPAAVGVHLDASGQVAVEELSPEAIEEVEAAQQGPPATCSEE